MSQYLLTDYLPALANTVVAELGVSLFFGFWSLRQLGAVVLVNLVTHPALHVVLWAGYWWHDTLPPLLVILGLELAVVLAEGVLLRIWLRLRTTKALAISATMNAASYLLGLMLFRCT
jgi:hypothetical protein